jgi:hypothetical protein
VACCAERASPRIGFLRDLVAQAPGPFEPLPSSWNTPWAGVRDRYILIYLGRRQPAWSDIAIPAGMRAHVDVIDTWNMTIETLPGIHEATITVPLPARPFMAVRLRATPTSILGRSRQGESIKEDL